MERAPPPKPQPKRSERLKILRESQEAISGVCQTTAIDLQTPESGSSDMFAAIFTASEAVTGNVGSEPLFTVSTAPTLAVSAAAIPIAGATPAANVQPTFNASADATMLTAQRAASADATMLTAQRAASADATMLTAQRAASADAAMLTAQRAASTNTVPLTAASLTAAPLTEVITDMQRQIETLQRELREAQQSLSATVSRNTVPPITVSFSTTSSSCSARNTMPFSVQPPTLVSANIIPFPAIGASETSTGLPYQATMPSYSSAYHSTPNADAARPTYTSQIAPRKLVDLPRFTGIPEDWPAFYTAFEETTLAYNYSNLENNQRLQKCLAGEAREAVKSLLIHPNNVFTLIEQLRSKFGRPDQLIRSQLNQIRDILPISEHAIGRIVQFATITRNLTAFLATAGAQQHLVNPTLLEELLLKLPLSKRVEWARYAACIRPYATVQHFSDWLNDLSNVICTVQTAEMREPKKRAVLYTAEKPSDNLSCHICQGKHVTAKCERLTRAAVADRWNTVKTLRLCFTCLKPGHTTRECRIRVRCTIDGCQRRHHIILHERKKRNDSAQQQQPCVTSSSSQPASQSDAEAQEAVLTCARRTIVETKLLFKVLPVTLYGPNKSVNTYALLDEGSSITLMDEAIAKELGLQGKKRQLEVRWIGGRSANEPSTVVDLHISGLNMRKRHKLKNVFSVPKLNLPVQSVTDPN